MTHGHVPGTGCGNSPSRWSCPYLFMAPFRAEAIKCHLQRPLCLEELGLELRLDVYCSWAPSVGNTLGAKVGECCRCCSHVRTESPLYKQTAHVARSEAETFPAGCKDVKGPLAVTATAV